VSKFYEKTQQVWYDEDKDVWYYSVIQRFSPDETNVEPLDYGTAEDEDDAMRLAGLA